MLTQEKIEFEQHQLGVGTLEIWSANVKISDLVLERSTGNHGLTIPKGGPFRFLSLN